MPSSIFYAGRVIRKPGSYVIVDASGLASQGLGALGVCAVIGTAEGGKPYSAIADLVDFDRINTADAGIKAYRSGDVKEAIPMLFEPSKDAEILNGAAQVIPIKVNPATRSTATFQGKTGGPAQDVMTLPSKDYGAFTSQTNVNVGAGTSMGKLLTVKFEGTTEAADNIGKTGDANNSSEFELQYFPRTSGAAGANESWSTLTAQVVASGIRAWATRTDLVGKGSGADVLADITDGNTVNVVSTNANDNGVQITVYGLDTGNNPAKETLIINGGGTRGGTQTWNKVLGAILAVAADGVGVNTISLQDPTGNVNLIRFSGGNIQKGVWRGTAMYVAGSPIYAQATAAANPAADRDLVVFGLSASGAAQSERLVIKSGAASSNTPAVSASSWSQIDVLVLGDVESTVTIVLSARAGETTNTVQTTLEKARDYFNARRIVNLVGPPVTYFGFVFAIKSVTPTRQVSTLDYTDDVGLDVRAAVQRFQADLDYQLSWFSTQSQIVGPATRLALVPQITDFTIVGDVGTTYTVTINGTAISNAGALSATAATIRDTLINRVNRDRRVQAVVSAGQNPAGAANVLRLTALVSASGSPVVAGFTATPGVAGAAGTLVAALAQTPSGANQPLTSTSSPVFLQGGSEGAPTFSDWQAAINTLKKIRVNTIVPLTGDPAVHAALDAHIAFMNTIGRSERDGLVGLSALDGQSAPTNALPSKNSVKAQIINLNTKNLRAFAQASDRFNTNGEKTRFLPWFTACLAAGMQSGAAVATPLTNKYVNNIGIAQDSSWNPVDDAEEMLQAGLCFLEEVPGVGRRVVRNITTWLKDDNPAYTEGSVNQAVNFATFEFRTRMEVAVGRKGFAGSVASAKSTATGALDAILRAEAIVNWRALAIQLLLDVLEVSAEIAPVIPINFVRSTLHLRAANLAA